MHQIGIPLSVMRFNLPVKEACWLVAVEGCILRRWRKVVSGRLRTLKEAEAPLLPPPTEPVPVPPPLPPVDQTGKKLNPLVVDSRLVLARLPSPPLMPTLPSPSRPAAAADALFDRFLSELEMRSTPAA